MSRERYSKVVYEQDGFRVVLTNQGERAKRSPHRLAYPNPTKDSVVCGVDGCEETTTSQTGLCNQHRSGNKYAYHPVDWIAYLLFPDEELADVGTSLLTHLQITRYMIDWASTDDDRLSTLDEFILERVEDDLLVGVPDATALQEDIESPPDEQRGYLAEYTEMAGQRVQETFIADGWERSVVTIPDRETGVEIDLPIPVAAALYYMAIFCEEANRGDAWYVESGAWDHSLSVSRSRAGGYMPLGFYLLLRYSDAPVSAAEQVVRSGYR